MHNISRLQSEQNSDIKLTHITAYVKISCLLSSSCWFIGLLQAQHYQSLVIWFDILREI